MATTACFSKINLFKRVLYEIEPLGLLKWIRNVSKFSTSENTVQHNNSSKIGRKSKYIEVDASVMDFHSATEAMIRKNYAVLDAIKKEAKRNCLAFRSEQIRHSDRSMQPRNYRPLKKPNKCWS